jgi:DNA-binding transcriptional ArsR family regulator
MVMTEPPLRPSLWRTCRVLANRTRLQIFGLLAQQSPLTVSAVALHLNVPLPVASQCLRALEARGLLAARRVGRRVQYRVSAPVAEQARELVKGLKSAFKLEAAPVDCLFRMATTFTHPRRIEIFRRLKQRASTFVQLHTATRISMPALSRHLGKLQARGFVKCCDGVYAAAVPAEALGRALARLAAG